MDNLIYQKNYKLLEQRWPSIVHYLESLNEEVNVDLVDTMPEKTLAYKGLHLSSCYNRTKEAQTQNTTIPETAEVAHLYGLGLGDAISDLLDRPHLKRLDVHILSPITFFIYLNFFDASTWLSDSRVHLHLAHNDKLEFPYSVNAAELFFAEENALEIQNLIQIDRNNAHQTQFHNKDMLELYYQNAANNECFTKKDVYVENLKDLYKEVDKTFVLVAGGPTASEQFSWLKQKREDYIIIAASTALIALEQAEIVPNFVAVLDPKPSLAKHLMVKKPELYNNTLLAYYPTASHEAVKAWPGKRVICLTDANPVLKEHAQRHPRSILFLGGSVAHTTAALAVLLGARKAILVGFDFCFTYGKSHLEHNPLAFAITKNSNEVRVLNGYNKAVASQLNFISYKQALEEFISANPQVAFYNTGKEGAIIKGAPWIES